MTTSEWITREVTVDGIVAEVEAQIEKMKCCANCKHSRTEYEHCKTGKHENWDIKK